MYAAVQTTRNIHLLHGRYLLTYPLSEKRLHSHLVFFVKNLEFEFESGRRSLLSLLHSVVNRFPVDVLDEQCEFLFLPLVVRLVNDDDAKCRSDIGGVLRRMVESVSPHKQLVLMAHCVQWVNAATSGGNAKLGRAGAQVLGFAVEKLRGSERNDGQHVSATKKVKIAVQKAAESVRKAIRVDIEWMSSGGEEDEQYEQDGAKNVENLRTGTDRDYKLYYSLIALEKLLMHWRSSVLQAYGIRLEDTAAANTKKSRRQVDAKAALTEKEVGVEFLSSITKLLLYKHAWVRLASCRIVGTFFQLRVTDLISSDLSDDVRTQFQQGLFSTMAALCSQLESPTLTDALATQVVKNLVFVGRHFLHGSIAEGSTEAEAATPDNESGDDESDDDGSDVEDIDPRGATSTGATKEARARAEAAQFTTASRALKWLFHRLSYMARTRGPAPQTAIYKWFAAMASSGANQKEESSATLKVLQTFLMHMLSPLVRSAANVKEGREGTPKYVVGELAQEVMAHLEENLGSPHYLAAHLKVINQIRKARLERRHKRKLAAVLDPEAHAARKRERNKRKRRQKRSKVDQYRAKDGRSRAPQTAQ